MILRNNFISGQTRQFFLSEKIQIKSKTFHNKQNSLIKSLNSYSDNNLLIDKNWTIINQLNKEKVVKLKSKKLIIYPYSISNNLLKEVLLKFGVKFVLTNEIKKANLIIGLKKHLRQNFKLKSLAKQKNIPIYTVNQLSFYQVSKLIKFICL